MTEQAGLAARLGAFVAGTSADAIPEDVRSYGKALVLDTLACMIGGARGFRHERLVDLARALGGAPESTMLCAGRRTGAVPAAMVNAEAGGALSAQESLYFMHSANVVLAVALALCERDALDGRRLLASFVVGYETTALVGMLRPVREPRDRDVHVSVGAAATAAHVLGLDPKRSTHALALAAATAPGDSRRPRLALASYTAFFSKVQCGMTAAFLAADGFTGYEDVLDPVNRPDDPLEPDKDVLVRGIGSTWWTPDACLKRHPTCRYLSGPLEQLERIVRDEQLRPDEIEEVVVRLAPVGYRNMHVSNASSAPDPSDPAEPLNLVFNAPYQAAMVVLGVEPGPRWHEPTHFDEPAVRALMARVTLEEDADLGERMLAEMRAAPHRRARLSGGAGVVVRARKQIFERIDDRVSGDPWDDETRADADWLRTKLRAYADGRLPGDRVDRVCGLVEGLEELADVRELVGLLA